jgi:hypothetical protein
MTQQAVTYLSVTADDLRTVVQECLREETYLSAKGAFNRFEFTKAFLRTLVDEGKIKAYPVADHSKVVRYKFSELEAVFLEHQSQGNG